MDRIDTNIPAFNQNLDINKVYDMIIVGGGPAGYAAALYGARAGLNVVVLEKLSAGGQMALTDKIDNYPGIDEGIDGLTLGEKMRAGAERFGAKSIATEVSSLEMSGKIKRVKAGELVLPCKTVVIATGAVPRQLGIPEENQLIGRGVSYCAHCDGMFYKGKTVAVVGGGNSAAEDALILSRFCKKVYLIHRRDSLRAAKIYRDLIADTDNIEFIQNSVVTQTIAEEKLSGLKLQNVKTGSENTVFCDGLFISIGRVPATDLVRGQLMLNDEGYILSGEDTCTNIAGVFAAGDVRTKALRQVVTAVSDGAVAVHYAEEYLASMEKM